ncbi:MAG: hypothetical protein AAGJ37_07150, partial [Pseudomonadota bacterium]
MEPFYLLPQWAQIALVSLLAFVVILLVFLIVLSQKKRQLAGELGQSQKSLEMADMQFQQLEIKYEDLIESKQLDGTAFHQKEQVLNQKLELLQAAEVNDKTAIGALKEKVASLEDIKDEKQ